MLGRGGVKSAKRPKAGLDEKVDGCPSAKPLPLLLALLLASVVDGPAAEDCCGAVVPKAEGAPASVSAGLAKAPKPPAEPNALMGQDACYFDVGMVTRQTIAFYWQRTESYKGVMVAFFERRVSPPLLFHHRIEQQQNSTNIMLADQVCGTYKETKDELHG